MRKRHFLALLCAFLLLLSLPACKRSEEPSPEAGNSGSEPSAGVEGGDTEGGDAPFSVRFDKNGTGFDTEKGLLFTPSTTTARDFTGDLSALSERMSECNAFAIGRERSNLTYKGISGSTPGIADNALYTLHFTADGETHTITIDDAAIIAYKNTDSDVSNIAALVDSFVNLTNFWNGTFA